MSRRHLILAGLLVAGAALRFATLDVQSYHHDEAVTAVRILPVGFGEMLDLVVESERSSHLYYVLAWLWSQPFGVGEVGLRSFSALVGTLTIAAAYLAGRELSGPRAGLVGAALVAASPVLIWYSLEARSYGLLVLFSTLALALCARSLRDPRPQPLVLWAVASALALAAHYFAFFIIAPQAVWLLYRHAARRRALLANVGVGIAGLALLPLVVAQQAGRGSDEFAERGLLLRTGELAKTFVTAERPRPLAGNDTADLIQLGATVGVVALLGLAAIAALAWGRLEVRRGAGLALGVGAAGVVVPFALAVVGVDFFNPRNMLGALVPLVLAGAVGLGAWWPGTAGPGPRWLAPAGLAAVLGLFALVLAAQIVSAQFQRYDWRGGVEALGQAAEPRVVVVNRNGDDPLLYYLDGAERFTGAGWAAGVRVREIAVLTKADAVRRPPGFELAEKRGLAPYLVMHRFRSQRPRLVRPARVARARVALEPSLALVDGGAAPEPR